MPFLCNPKSWKTVWVFQGDIILGIYLGITKLENEQYLQYYFYWFKSNLTQCENTRCWHENHLDADMKTTATDVQLHIPPISQCMMVAILFPKNVQVKIWMIQ